MLCNELASSIGAMDFGCLSSDDDGELSTSTTSESESKSASKVESEPESNAEAEVEVVEEKMKSIVNESANVHDISEFPLLHSFFSSHPSCNVFDQLV